MKSVALSSRFRIGGVAFEAAFWPLWHVAALLLVILAPSQLRLGLPFWRLPPNQISQGLVMGVAYLALALFLRPQGSHRTHLFMVIAASLVCFGSGYLFLLAPPDISYSRVLILISLVLGGLLAWLPFVLRRYRPRGLLALACASSAILAIGMASPKGETPGPGPKDRVVWTALNAVSVTYLRKLLDPVESEGGGISKYGDGFLLVTGSGEIYRLEWEPGKNVLRPARLPFSVPMDRKTFLADQPKGARAQRLRVTDVIVDSPVSPKRIYVAHQHWNREGKCFTMRVSMRALPDVKPSEPTPDSAWSTVFESQPCLRINAFYDGIESGGRLAWTREGKLLLSLGEFEFSVLVGASSMAQAENSDYGKVLLLDLAGGRKIFTMGHRNPQGLFVDRKGRIWETEHGPQGGDELNLLYRGRNYGWPFVTYGTQYGLAYWPTPKPDDGKVYEDPVHAFTPAIAISNLIELGPAMFPEWDGDLLVASLRLQSLYRIRLRGDRVAYVEPIKIGRRIRDVEQGTDGRVVLWTDESDIVVLARAEREPEGLLLSGMCAQCHQAIGGGSAVGPSLRGIVGRPVASEPGYPYSPAMTQLGGAWTAERLDVFLRDPWAYAPGTSMDFRGLPDPADRRALIEYLKSDR